MRKRKLIFTILLKNYLGEIKVVLAMSQPFKNGFPYK